MRCKKIKMNDHILIFLMQVHVLLASRVVAGIKACKTTMASHETIRKYERGAKKQKMYQQKRERCITVALALCACVCVGVCVYTEWGGLVVWCCVRVCVCVCVCVCIDTVCVFCGIVTVT